jgi:GTP-binding protein
MKPTTTPPGGAHDAIQLETPRRLTLEAALEFISDDELVEMTPVSIRLRKRFLKAHERKKNARQAG